MTSLESALAECDALRAELEEAKKQARLGWERAAEKDRAYGEALRERDEARAVDAGRTRFCEQCMAVARERDELQANVDFLIQSNRADILVLLEIHRKQVAELKAERDEARAEVARLCERIATQDDGLRYGEKVCANLMGQIEKLRERLNALAVAHERDVVAIWHEATDAAHPPGSAQEVVEAVRSLRQERNAANRAVTPEELDAVRNHIGNIPSVGAMYAPALVEWAAVLLRQRDEVTAQRDNAVDASKEGAWMARALDAERERGVAQAATVNAALIHADLVRERDEARRDLGEILAVIHRDGGHYTGEHGISKSVADAHATWAAVVREREEAQAELAFLRKEYGEAESSTLTRDALELKAQVLEASLLHVCKAASEITSWDFSHLLLEHPDAKTLLGDVAALEAALKQHGPERS